MAETYRSAMGKNVDMAALRTQNEKVRAVGNMLVNARGDTIDSNGNVIQDNNKRVNEYYMKAVMNRAARTGDSPVLPGRSQPVKQVAEQVIPPQVPEADVSPVSIPQYAVEQDYSAIVESNKQLEQEMYPDETEFEDDEEVIKPETKSKKNSSK